MRGHLGVEEPFSPAKKAHPAFIVGDLAAIVRIARSSGYRVVDDQPLPGFTRTYLSDPFGNRIEILQPA